MKSKHPNTKMPTDEEMVEAFKAYDKDGNGRIEKKEKSVRTIQVRFDSGQGQFQAGTS